MRERESFPKPIGGLRLGVHLDAVGHGGALTAGVVMLAGKSDKNELQALVPSVLVGWLLMTMVTKSVIHLSVTTHLCFGSVPQLVH